MECKTCESTDWELVWYKALVEEGTTLSLYQCKNCKRVVMASEDTRYSKGGI